jgi:hypothetical protein
MTIQEQNIENKEQEHISKIEGIVSDIKEVV